MIISFSIDTAAIANKAKAIARTTAKHVAVGAVVARNATAAATVVAARRVEFVASKYVG